MPLMMSGAFCRSGGHAGESNVLFVDCSDRSSKEVPTRPDVDQAPLEQEINTGSHIHELAHVSQ